MEKNGCCNSGNDVVTKSIQNKQTLKILCSRLKKEVKCEKGLRLLNMLNKFAFCF